MDNKELELKYCALNNDINVEVILKSLLDKGYEIIDKCEKTNCDDYYDTENFDLFKSKSSLRTRKITKNNTFQYKCTYKKPITNNYNYVSRIEIEKTIPNLDFGSLNDNLQEYDLDVDLNKVIKTPIINCTTNRLDIKLSKNNTNVCMSIDNITYMNYLLSNTKCTDQMLEVELIDSNNTLILNEINDIISNIKNLRNIKQSKYERSIIKTYNKYSDNIKKLIKQ